MQVRQSWLSTALLTAILLAGSGGSSVFAMESYLLNGSFETPDPDPAYTPYVPGAPWGTFRSTNAIDNWDWNDTIELDTGLYSTMVADWRYGGDYSPYAYDAAQVSGDSILGLLAKHDWAQFGGVQQDIGTMTVGKTLTLNATMYGHVHSDQNTVWGTDWENCDATLYQIAFYNVTDGVVLSSITEADFPVGFKAGYMSTAPDVVPVTMEYTPVASDEGDTLRLLLLPRDPGEGLMSQVGIDNVLVTSQGQWLSELSRGHNILLDRGLQIQALTSPEFDHPTKQFDLARWAESNFTTAHFWANNYPVDQMPPPPPGIPWGLTDYNEPGTVEGDIEPEAYPYAASLVSYQLKDEQNITDPAELAYLAAEMAAFHANRPNVITYTNQHGGHSTDDIRDYMQQVQPDILCFDNYPFDGSVPGGSPTDFYRHMQRFRQLALAGNDGTGAQPIPYALYTQTFTYDGVDNHIVSESEIRLNNFSAWAFGYTFVDSFMYDPLQYGPDAGGGANFGPVFFTGGDTDLPTPQFYQVAETNRQSLNLGPALVRLISTDVRMIMGRHPGGVTNTLPAGVSSWDSGADPYITSIAVTNLGSKNDDYEGDVIVGYFKPLHESFTSAGHEDDIYFMIVNALSDATGSAADCAQLIQIQFDFSGTEIDSLLRLSRETGLVEQVSLVNLTGSVYGLDLYLDGGTGDLFKFNNGGLFVGEFLESLLGDANLDGLVSADDYASVQANFGNTGAAGGGLLGDANHDGLVSADDYASIQANFGNTSGGMSAVPEPATLGLLAIGLMIALLSRRTSTCGEE